KLLKHRDGYAEGRQNDHVGRLEGLNSSRRLVLGGRVAQEANTHRPKLFVDMRVVNDFAGEKYSLIGEPLAGLVGVVDGAIDAVAEAEFAREMDGQASCAIRKVVVFDL